MGIHSSILPNDKSNVELMEDNVERSETIDKSTNENDNVQKEHSNDISLGSVHNESNVTRNRDFYLTQQKRILAY